ncbi:MAG: DUF3656 domain-containing protein, partial [Lachnospiraceae bacterium]
KKIEILAPAGSYESLKAAVKAGADAVYIGGSCFGARAYADNLNEEKLLEAIDYVHLHDCKIYLTINTLLKEKEIEKQLYDYLLPYYRQGIDAVIVQDVGVLEFIKERFPDLPIHASTQMTITNVAGAKFLEEQGVERVVPARELNLTEIREIAEHTGLEVECFVHGALCYCYSGQCLFSSLVGGRSGNRGQCAQPCRLPYQVEGEKNPSYLLSLKDICTLQMIPEMVKAGITSFKIEGRMKKPEYVAIVTAMYRKYLDLYETNAILNVAEQDKEMLMDLYNRGGSCDGYYHVHNGKDMISRKRPNHAGVPAIRIGRAEGRSVSGRALTPLFKGDVIELGEGKETYTLGQDIVSAKNVSFVTYKPQNFVKGQILNRTRNEHLLKEIKQNLLEKKVQEKIKGLLLLRKTEPATLQLTWKEITVTVEGDIPQPSQNQPMDVVRVEKQMHKTGNTEFIFAELKIQMESDLFLSMQSLNELRRQGLLHLQEAICKSFRREVHSYSQKLEIPTQKEPLSRESYQNTFFVSIEQQEQFEEAVKAPSVSRMYLDCNLMAHGWNNEKWKELVSRGKQAHKEVYFAMPHIFRKMTKEKYETSYAQFSQFGFDGILVRNFESYAFLKEHGYHNPIVLDHNLYQFNHHSRRFWERQPGDITHTAALELNARELKEVGTADSELLLYGYLPMMLSAQCILNTTKGCTHRTGFTTITDRYQKEFVVKNCCDYCYNIIYNTTPVILADKKQEIMEIAPFGMRLAFTTENGKMTKRILTLFQNTILGNESWDSKGEEFTRGHFNRGVK